MMNTTATANKFRPMHDALCNVAQMILVSTQSGCLSKKDRDALKKIAGPDGEGWDVDSRVVDRNIISVDFFQRGESTVMGTSCTLSFWCTFHFCFKRGELVKRDDGSVWTTFYPEVTVDWSASHGRKDLNLACRKLAFYGEILKLALQIELSLPKKFDVCLRSAEEDVALVEAASEVGKGMCCGQRRDVSSTLLHDLGVPDTVIHGENIVDVRASRTTTRTFKISIDSSNGYGYITRIA